MTYTLKITPTTMALLDGYCRAAGRSLKSTLGLHLTERAAAAAAADATADAVSAQTPIAAAPAAPAAPAAALPEYDIDDTYRDLMTR